MNELVSVVVPIYNVEKYLNRCIESIVSQTYSNLEILLIDDESPDNCPRMCDEWAEKDSRIIVIHKKNEGLGKARNTGIENATGKYICFFDSDDYIEPNTIESCVKAIFENNADMVAFGHNDVTPDMELLGTYIPNTPQKMFIGEEIKNVLLPNSLYSNLKTGENWNMIFSSCTKLYSVDVIKKTGWHFASEREIISEDFYSLTELYGHLNSVFIIDRVFYNYTVNKSSLSRSYRGDRYEKIKFFHDSMVALSEKMNISDVLEQSINGVTFGLVVGAMKLIVASELKFKDKYSELCKIVKDDFLHRLIIGTDYSGAGLQTKLLYKATKYKLIWLCFLFIYFKSKREAK